MWIPLERLTKEGNKNTCQGSGGAQIKVILEIVWKYEKKVVPELPKDDNDQKTDRYDKVSNLFLNRKASVIQRAVRKYLTILAEEREVELVKRLGLKRRNVVSLTVFETEINSEAKLNGSRFKIRANYDGQEKSSDIAKVSLRNGSKIIKCKFL